MSDNILKFPVPKGFKPIEKDLEIQTEAGENRILAVKTKLENVIKSFSKGFQNNTLSLCFLIADKKKDVYDIHSAIYRIEPRFLVKSLHKYNDKDRSSYYRYVATHIIILTRSQFKKDLGYITELAKVNSAAQIATKEIKVPGLKSFLQYEAI